MKYALTAAMAREADRITMEEMGVPSAALMERAAEAVALKTGEIAAIFNRSVKIVSVCGCGNNGADAIAAARILSWQGLHVDIAVAGSEERASEEFIIQKNIALHSGMCFVNINDIPEYDIVIDGIFGTGFKGGIRKEYEKVISLINESKNVVVSVDVPSGTDATTGRIVNNAVKADATVTFGYVKTGLMQYPARMYAGEITVSDIGIYPWCMNRLNPPMYFTPEDLGKIPDRKPDANKGTYGRLLIIAGSRDMSGAAYMSALAAFRTGAGLVEIITHEKNRELISRMLPEAITAGYTGNDAIDLISDKLKRASCVIMGPGMSQSETAEKIVKYVTDNCEVPLIMDADALNIAAKDISVLKRCRSTVIITPHIGEMSRLTGMTAEELKDGRMEAAGRFAADNDVIVVMKDAVTVVAENNPGCRMYINASGTSGMAKAGSGDVLTGIIAGMYMMGVEPYSAAAMGVYVHGLAGEEAAAQKGINSVIATDIAEHISDVIRSM